MRGPKDAAIALASRTFLNSKLRGIGEITDFSIDTKKHALHSRVLLSGEVKPIDIYITNYVVRRHGKDATLTVVAATASRQWVAAALHQFVIGRRFTIPAQAGAALRLLT